MSSDYNGLFSGVKYLGIITGKEFEEAYNEMSASPDKTPVASTVLPVRSNVQSSVIGTKIQAWIFYKVREPQGSSKPKKRTLKMEL